ncbi:MAG TPA: glycosyltransferase [Pirellulales bacterium]|nr:glycosyltransferase [Pirellulales bacterium]
MGLATRPKFLVLSNGLKDQLGHYYETSISVAEAARRAGFEPILGTHVDCRGDLCPDWLTSHALFRTDHWMWKEPTALEKLTTGRSSISTSLIKICRRAIRLAERGAYFLLPPLFYDAGRLVAYCCLPRVAAPASRAHALAGLRRLGFRLRYGHNASLAEQASPWPRLHRAITGQPASPRIFDAAGRLLPEGLAPELEYALIFLEDLERFLSAASAGPNDHVLLQTAHAREVLAVHLAVERLGAQSPVFHLEFRHPLLEQDGNQLIETPQTRIQRSFLQLHVDWGKSDRIRFYTDSEVLSGDYESLVDLSFGVLPLPFRAELMPQLERPSQAPITLVYLGGARDEKGFHWLPELIEALDEDYLAPGRARLLIQSSLGQPEHNPRSVAALRRLRKRPGVELIGRAGALAPAEYYELAAQADIMLLPYLRGRYRACTSGVLAEALAAGATAVVPAGTWLADQLPAGGGETFDGDLDTFVAATRQVLNNFHAYRAAAQAHRAAWLNRHSPDALVATLVGERSDVSQTRKLAA